MRIRKHAKISPFLYAAGSSSSSPPALLRAHVCLLNQSPWDVIDFSPPSTPPPLSQVNGIDSFIKNGSSIDSMAISGRKTDEATKGKVSDNSFHGGAASTKDQADRKIIICSKTDGRSWKCPREAARGNSLCEHHLSMVRSYCNPAHSSSKNSTKSLARVKNHSTRSSSNPYVFYYYSGFGPQWGKRRGKTSGGARETGMEPSNIRPTGDADALDYSEKDEEGEDEEDQLGNGRSRKRIKARSLKSLM